MSAPRWIRSSYCDSAGLDCIEVAAYPEPTPSVRIRDTKVSLGPTLTVAPRTWARFIDGIERLAPDGSPRFVKN
ncbi:DUF397 domain-containing protein [Streptomyces sioyaensis]|uniref:DUF397 domain-containing protein n=1 Tax=Streptomyces sioyaensis TaxID=67364 RepID=UPI003791333F